MKLDKENPGLKEGLFVFFFGTLGNIHGSALRPLSLHWLGCSSWRVYVLLLPHIQFSCS